MILRFAHENPTWGYDRIQGALANVGYHISDTTIGNILKAHGIEPSPKRERSGSWSTFLKAHWETLAAIDFTTCEVWTMKGLVTVYILIVMQLKSRRVEIAGITTSPDTAWMTQMTRNLTNSEDGFLRGTSHLILDRDTKFLPLRTYLAEHTHTKPLLLPPRSPDLNCYVERFCRTLAQRVSRSDDLLRRSLAAAGASRVHDPFSLREKSPRSGEPDHRSEPEVGQTCGRIACPGRGPGPAVRSATTTAMLPESLFNSRDH